MPVGHHDDYEGHVMAGKASGHLQVRGGKGKRQWHALWRDAQGRRHHRVLGPAHVKDSGARTDRGSVVWRAGDGRKPTPEHLTPREARSLLDEVLADARLAPAEPVPREAVRTLGDAWAEWLRHIEFDRNRKPSTVRDYASQTRRYLLDEFGADLPLSELTTERIEEWQQEMLERGHLARRTIQKAQVCLHAILKRAKKKRWVERNAAEDADRITLKPSGDFNVLSVEECEALIRAAENETDAAIFRTAISCGLRMGELRALRWRDVDFARRLIHVRWSIARHTLDRPKSASVRSVPMADQVAAALDALSRRGRFVGDDDFVFCTPLGEPRSDYFIRGAFYEALDRAGLGHLRTKEHAVRFHDLRHTFGTLAVQAAPISDVQAWMGHAQIQTTMIYVHYVPQHDAAEKLTRLFEAGAPSEELRLTA
ncbi:MAG TPA: tyrosine-type recombinase/integrase [Solirubrobacteraceae bacterium]|nr:tyrosine-type recombinase/integrase [Solirubrobacteraceae bacterium]